MAEDNTEASPKTLRDRYALVRNVVKTSVEKGLSHPRTRKGERQAIQRGAFLAAEEELTNSMLDPLTGLYNLNGRNIRLAEEVARIR